MIDENRHEIVSETSKMVGLIIFSAIVWGLIWKVIWHYIGKAANFSPDAFLKAFSSVTPEKQIELLEAMGNEFYFPHLFLVVANIALVPLFVGFYIGRHSPYKKYFDVAITVSIVLISKPIVDLLFHHFQIVPFITIVLFKGYLFFPFLFGITSLGAWIGSFRLSTNEKALYLRIYRDIYEKRKKGFLYSAIVLLSLASSVETVDKKIEEVLSSYLSLAYAPVTFNSHSKDRPTLQLSNSTKNHGTMNWVSSTNIDNEDSLALIFYYNNSSRLYKAINTRLALKQSDRTHFTATLWADNAQPVQGTVEFLDACNNQPLFTYQSSSWYPDQMRDNQSKPLPFKQSGQEILNPDGLNIGDVEGLWAGQGYFVVKLRYNCRS